MAINNSFYFFSYFYCFFYFTFFFKMVMINNKTIYYIGNLFFINFLQTHTQIVIKKTRKNTSRRQKGKAKEWKYWKAEGRRRKIEKSYDLLINLRTSFSPSFCFVVVPCCCCCYCCSIVCTDISFEILFFFFVVFFFLVANEEMLWKKEKKVNNSFGLFSIVFDHCFLKFVFAILNFLSSGKMFYKKTSVFWNLDNEEHFPRSVVASSLFLIYKSPS